MPTIIKNAKYTRSGMIEVEYAKNIRKTVPNEPSNKERVELMQWENQGNEIELFSLTLDEMKDEARLNLGLKHAEILRNLTGDATIEERDTWQAKALAAQAISDGNASAIQTEMLETEATLSGVEVSDLVTTILTKSGAFMKMISLAAGHRTATHNAIKSAPDIPTLGLILEKANSRAEELVDQFLQEVAGG